jgi:hypothetical protein
MDTPSQLVKIATLKDFVPINPSEEEDRSPLILLAGSLATISPPIESWQRDEASDLLVFIYSHSGAPCFSINTELWRYR